MKKINPVLKYFLKIFSIIKSNIRDYGMYIALLTIFGVFSIMTGGIFLGPVNFTNLLNQTAYVAVLAVGITLVIVTRQIDLSVGYLGAFLGAYIVVAVENKGDSILLALLSALIVTVVVGFIKGFFIAKVKVPSFVVTLAGMFVFKGLLMFKTNNRTVSASNPFFKKIGLEYLSNYKVGNFNLLALLLGVTAILLIIILQIVKRVKSNKSGIPVEDLSIFITKQVLFTGILGFLTYNLSVYNGISYLLFITLIVVAIYHFITTKTVLGRRVYAVGGNPEAAKLSGISVQKIIIFTFISMGILAMISGLMYVSMLQNASPLHGPSWEMYAIAAAYIGGTSANGGVGKVINSVIGAIVMMSLKNGMALAGLPANIEPIVLGSVLLLAVVFDIYTRNVRAIDMVGVHYAKSEYKQEYLAKKNAYMEAKKAVKEGTKLNVDNLLELEFELTKTQGEFNQIKDKIRTAKEEDYLPKLS